MKPMSTWIVRVVAIVACAAAQAQSPARVTFNIEPQPIRAALKEFGKQTGLQILLRVEGVPTDGVNSPSVTGELTPQSALEQLLSNSGLKYEFVNDRTVRIVPVSAQSVSGSGQQLIQRDESLEQSATMLRLAQNASSEEKSAQGERRAPADSQEEKGDGKGIPEVLVRGSKVLNMDIRRSKDDAQPYVVFNRETLEQSGAANLEEFLKTRLTMNTSSVTNSQTVTFSGSASSINLRGLGANQTLILIDGRRAPNMFVTNTVQQPDINGIPLAAIERVEVLPTTASGIYGGGATGGVINIIMRRDYSGAEVKVNYENSFDSDTADRHVDLAAGFDLEGGKTNVLVSASYAERNRLTVADRDFTQDYRYRIVANNGNNPQIFNSGANPPMGATTNIRSSTGANLTLKNGTALNSPITYVPAGYSGTAANGSAFLANAGNYNLQWSEGSSIDNGGLGLFSGPKVKSGMVTVRRKFSSRIDAFVDASISENDSVFPFSNLGVQGFTIDSTAPNNPFMQSILVSFAVPSGEVSNSTNHNRRASAGAIFSLPRQWTAQIDHSWGETHLEYVFPITSAFGNLGTLRTAVANGSVDVLRDPAPDYQSFYTSVLQYSVRPQRVTLEDSTARLAGKIGSLWAGPISLSALLEHRLENIGEGSAFNGNVIVTPERSQTVDSAYLEIQVPLVSERNGIPGVRELELQLAARRDEYATRGVTGQLVNPTPTTPITRVTNDGSSTDPTFALRYQPVQDVAVRASYGTGFLPPSVSQLVPNAPLIGGSLSFFDPKRGGGLQSYTGLTVINGGNANLTPEKSKSWSVGTIFTPHWVPGLRVSLDYTRIDKDNIVVTLDEQQIANNEDVLPGRITRGANLPGDPAGWAGVVIGMDRSAVNLSRALIRAYDMQLDYQLPVTRIGTFDLSVNSTWQTHYKQQTVPSATFVERVGYTGTAPLKRRANAQLTWTREPLRIGWAAHYFDSYVVYAANATPASITALSTSQGNGGKVDSQIYHDLFARYQLFQKTEFTVGVKNLFNTNPPLDAGNTSLAYYSRFGDPRLATYYLSAKHSF